MRSLCTKALSRARLKSQKISSAQEVRSFNNSHVMSSLTATMRALDSSQRSSTKDLRSSRYYGVTQRFDTSIKAPDIHEEQGASGTVTRLVHSDVRRITRNIATFFLQTRDPSDSSSDRPPPR